MTRCCIRSAHAIFFLNAFSYSKKLASLPGAGGEQGAETSGLLGAVSDEVAFVFRVDVTATLPPLPCSNYHVPAAMVARRVEDLPARSRTYQRPLHSLLKTKL